MKNILLINFKYSKYTYNASISILVVKFILFSIHESVTNIIYNEFSVARKSFFEAWDFDIISNQNFMKFAKQYSEFFKIFNLAVKFTDFAWNI